MNRGGNRRRVFYVIVICVLWGMIGTCPATADIITTGDVVPTYDGTDPWVLSTDLILGQSADASLLVSEGSQVQTSSGPTIASGPDVTASVTVTGTGSVWDSQNRINVGKDGNGTMTIENGARLVSREVFVGITPGSVGRLVVTGPGTTWDGHEIDPNWPSVFGPSGTVIGGYGTGEVIISNGARVTTNRLPTTIGWSGNGTGSLTVTGPNSVWEDAGYMVIGRLGTGSLLISNGGTVTSAKSAAIASESAPGSATVTGPGSTWQIGESLLVGMYGQGELLVSDGGYLSSAGAYIAENEGSTGDVVVTGADSLWENAGLLSVANEGEATLTISDGGVMTNEGHVLVGYTSSEGHGSVTVTGPGSLWETGIVEVGLAGTGSVLISDGATATSDPWVTITARGDATVTNPGSVWRIGMNISVAGGDHERLLISNGGRIETDFAHVHAARIVGPGSALYLQSYLSVGQSMPGWMTIEDGGQVTDVFSYVGLNEGIDGLVEVKGAGSSWTNTDALYLGGSHALPGGNGVLRILDGGLVQANSVLVWEGGAIEGDGIVRATQTTNHGIVRPGNSIGTLAIDGDLTMDLNSVLETEIDNSGQSDKLSVTGDMSVVDGTVHVVPVDTITQLQQYTIVEADSVSGTFGTIESPDTLLAMLSYEPDSVSLMVTPFDGMPCMTRNQRALGTALQSIANVGPTSVTSLLQQVPTLDGVRASYDQLSGQSRPPLAPIAATDSAKFMGIVSNRLQGARGIVADSLDSLSDSPLLAMASPDERGDMAVVSDAGLDSSLSDQDAARSFEDQDWGIWGKLYGLYGDRDTEHGTPGYSYEGLGQSFGIDVQFTERFIGGLTGGYSNTQVDYDHLADRADIDTTHAGLYGSYSADGWYLNYVATHSWLDFDTLRVVDLTGERHKGSFDGYEWSGYVEAGLDWQPAASWLVQPLAGLQVTYLYLDQYAETGSTSALVYEAQDYESYRGSLGARVTKELVLGSHGRSAILQGRARWVHEFGDVTSSVDARFEDVPSVFFTVSDEAVSRDSLLLGTGIGIRLTRGLRAFVDYDASLNADITAQVISGAVEYRW